MTNDTVATTTTLFEVFANEADADAFMRSLNRALRNAHSKDADLVVLIEWDGQYAVVDMGRAIEMGVLYKWAI